MNQRFKRYFGLFALISWDIISVTIASFASFRILYAGHYSREGIWYNPMTWLPNEANWKSNIFTFILIGIATMIFLNIIFKVYGSLLKNFGVAEIARVIGACLSFGALFFVVNYQAVLFKNNYIFIMTLSLLILQIGARSSVRFFNEFKSKVNTLQRYKSGCGVRTLIYGAGEAGSYFVKKVQIDETSNVIPIAMVDDDKLFTGTRIHGVKVYGTKENLSELIKRFQIEEVIVAIPTANKQTLQYAVDVCRENKCKIRRFGNIDDIDMSNVKLTQIDIVELLRRDKINLNMASVKEFVKDKTVLVTGGAGSIGSEICRQVLGFECKHLVVFDIHENGLYEIEQELKANFPGKFSLRLGTIREAKRLNEVFEEFTPQIVFHAAAHKHVPMMEYSPKEAIKNNVRGTINVAMAAMLHNVEKFILISTDKAVNPTNIMGASKRIAEKAIQLLDTMSKTDFSAVRFGNVLGSNGSVVPLFTKQIEAGGPITVTHPEITRYFMTIPEAVQLVLEAGAMAKGGEIFVLNMGEPIKIYDLACDLIKLSGLEPEVDIKITYTGLRPGEKLFEEISLSDEDMSKTPNDKIYIMKPMTFDSTQLSNDLKELELAAFEGTTEEMFAKVRELVPTFDHKS